MAGPSALQKAMQLSDRTVMVSELPAELCSTGAADVRIAMIFQQFGEVVAVCLHPSKAGEDGWGTVTFAQAGDAAGAVRAASVSVEVSALRKNGPHSTVLQLPVQRATLAMESRAMAAIQLDGRGPTPVRRRGHSSFRTRGLQADERVVSSRDSVSNAELSERSAFVRDAIFETVGSPCSRIEKAVWDGAVERLATEVPSRLWSAMRILRQPPTTRSQRDISALVTMARHQQIGFITKLTGPEQRRICAALRLHIVPVGHQVYTEGSAADAMYIILHGTATAITQQGGGGNRRKAQLLMEQAESEEDSDDEEQYVAQSLSISNNDDNDVPLSTRTPTPSTCASVGATTSSRHRGSGATVAVIETEERKIGDLGVGQHFGELALLKPASIRTATVMMREPSILLRVNQEDFASATRLRDEERAELEARLSRLRQCPLFQGLPLRVLLDLAELTEYRCCAKGTVLYEQGQSATDMCLVLSGKVAFSANIPRQEACSLHTPSSAQRELNAKQASMFQRRTNTVRSSQTCPGSATSLVSNSKDASPMHKDPASAARETGYWHVDAGNLGAGAIVGSEGLPPDGMQSSRSVGTRHEVVPQHCWTTTAANDVEVLELRVHTLINRTSPVVLERLYEYAAAELSRQNLEKAVGLERQWQQKRSELFVHITGKGQTQKQVQLQELWAARAARASVAAQSTPRKDNMTSAHDTAGLSMKTLSTLRKRSQSINTTGQRHKQEVRWIERLKERTAEMSVIREQWRADPALKKHVLEMNWAKAHPDFVQTMALHDQLARENWDPMTSAAAPSDLGQTRTRAIVDGSRDEVTQNSQISRNPSASRQTKEMLLRGININTALYSVAFEETVVLCGSVGCADLETQKFAGFGYLSWLYWVEHLFDRFQHQLKDEGMAEHFKLVHVGMEGFIIMATTAPTGERPATCTGSVCSTSNLGGNQSDLDDTASRSSFASHTAVNSTSTSSDANPSSNANLAGDSLEWFAKQLLQFGVWMLDEAKATNDRADRLDRTAMNAHQYSTVEGLRPSNPTTGLIDTGVDKSILDSALESLHYVHGGRRGLLQTHRMELRIGVATGQCAAYALGMRQPILFQPTGPALERAQRLCNEADGGSMMLSPAVEGLIGKSMEGLTRVPLRTDKIARNAEELAALEAEKELEDVVAAQRALEAAIKSGSIELIRKAKEQLLIEQEEADEAVRAASAAKILAQEKHEEDLRALEAARIARIDATTGPKHHEYGWRNGRRNIDCLTPQQISNVDARRRLMSHRPKDNLLKQNPDAGRAMQRPNTAPAANSLGNDNNSTLMLQTGCADVRHAHQRSSKNSTRTQSPEVSARTEATPGSLSARRPQSARPVLQSQNSSVLHLSWQAPPGIGRAGSACAASAMAASRRRQRLRTSRPYSCGARPMEGKMAQPIKANPPTTPRHTRPQSAHGWLISNNRDDTSPATGARQGAKRNGETRRRPASARPVLENHAFSARA